MAKTKTLIQNGLHEARSALYEVGDWLRATITSAKALGHPAPFSEAVVAKLIESQQALYAAQRLIEAQERAAHVAAMEEK